MNIVFMGTPDFAVTALEQLVKAHNVTAVFTQPDKPKNRGKKMQFTPVKETALKYGIPVYQPDSLRKGEDAEQAMRVLTELQPDCIVVAAYGQHAAVVGAFLHLDYSAVVFEVERFLLADDEFLPCEAVCGVVNLGSGLQEVVVI